MQATNRVAIAILVCLVMCVSLSPFEHQDVSKSYQYAQLQRHTCTDKEAHKVTAAVVLLHSQNTHLWKRHVHLAADAV